MIIERDKMKNNVYIYKQNTFKANVIDAKTIINNYDKDYLNNLRHHTPEEIFKKFRELNKELKQIINKFEDLKYWGLK
jgi:hypothetical protein